MDELKPESLTLKEIAALELTESEQKEHDARTQEINAAAEAKLAAAKAADELCCRARRAIASRKDFEDTLVKYKEFKQ